MSGNACLTALLNESSVAPAVTAGNADKQMVDRATAAITKIGRKLLCGLSRDGKVIDPELIIEHPTRGAIKGLGGFIGDCRRQRNADSSQ